LEKEFDILNIQKILDEVELSIKLHKGKLKELRYHRLHLKYLLKTHSGRLAEKWFQDGKEKE